jgi:hypothetical protein
MSRCHIIFETLSSSLPSPCTTIRTLNQYKPFYTKTKLPDLSRDPPSHDPRAKTCECSENLQSTRLNPPIPYLARHSTSAVLGVAFLQSEDDKSAKCPSHRSGSIFRLDTLRVVHAHKRSTEWANRSFGRHDELSLLVL